MEADFTLICSQLGQLLQQKSWLITTAESCTGGGLAQALTAVAGSSAWFERGFVTYSNKAKEDMLGVEQATLARYGAVSEETAKAMAKGALLHSDAQVSIAITGIAGPSGGTPEKPVGLVWFALALSPKNIKTQQKIFKGDRLSVRQKAIDFVLKEMLAVLKNL